MTGLSRPKVDNIFSGIATVPVFSDVLLVEGPTYQPWYCLAVILTVCCHTVRISGYAGLCSPQATHTTLVPLQ